MATLKKFETTKTEFDKKGSRATRNRQNILQGETSKTFDFTFTNIEDQYKTALELGYSFITCKQYSEKNILPPLTVVNRVDIDFSVKKADRIREIFDRLGIKATFFIRMHAPEYNPFSFENYRIIKHIRDSGHEIGYHSEVVDQAAIWNEDAELCLLRDISIINLMFDINVSGVASHGGSTGLNNLDFWKSKRASKYGLYEAYEESAEFNLWREAFYVSDSEWTRWKCYDRGVLIKDDDRSFGEHLKSKRPLIYLLIHSDTYYDNHIYE